MASDKSVFGVNDVVPALQLLRARRVYSLFRMMFYSGIIFLLLSFIKTFLIDDQLLFRMSSFDDFERTVLTSTISRSIYFFSVLASAIFIGLPIPIGLEVGFSVKNWPAIYRDARNIIDEITVEKIEANNIARFFERQVAAESESQGFDQDGANAKEMYGTNLTEIRVAADLKETERWVAANYPALTRAIIERIQSEISTQGSRANINLSIALVVATVGVVILGWLSFDVTNMLTVPPKQTEYAVMLYAGAFAAKLALAISANIFAFFFLSTYRRNLSEIRYFHNELTNVQIRILALYIAADRNIDSSLALAIRGLSSTERNFILKKGESTTDLSLKNLDSTEISTLTALFREMVQVAQKKQDAPPASQ